MPKINEAIAFAMGKMEGLQGNQEVHPLGWAEASPRQSQSLASPYHARKVCVQAIANHTRLKLHGES